MSLTKRIMEHQQDQRRAATDIAVKSNVLARCEDHDEVYDPLNGDNVPAYKLGNFLLSLGELNGIFSDSREMTDSIKAVIEDAGMKCHACGKIRGE